MYLGIIFFKKIGPFPASFSLNFGPFNKVKSKYDYLKFCRWLDLNCRPLVSEATALPTEPQPLPIPRHSLLRTLYLPTREMGEQTKR